MLKDIQFNTQGTFLKLTLYYIKLKYLNFSWFILPKFTVLVKNFKFIGSDDLIMVVFTSAV